MSYENDKIEWAKTLESKDLRLTTEMGVIIALSKRIVELEDRISQLEEVIKK